MALEEVDAIVIGSGPAGVSATSALLELDKTVLMLDIGLGNRDEDQIPGRIDFEHGYESISKLTQSSVHGVPLKTYQGSVYPFWIPQGLFQLKHQKAFARPSFAKGGHSEVWGCSVLPFFENDILDWPEDAKIRTEDYQNASSLFKVSTDLSSSNGYFKNDIFQKTEGIPLAGRSHYSRLKQKSKALQSVGLSMGASKIAVHPMERKCTWCAQCLEGCPEDVLFSSKQWIHEFEKNPKFKRIDFFQVTNWEEKSGLVTVYGKDIKNQKHSQYHAKKIFVGAGVLPTFQLVCRSLKLKRATVKVSESRQMMIPIVYYKNDPDVIRNHHRTVSHSFLEDDSKEISSHLVHMQLYGANSKIVQVLRKHPITKFFPEMIKSNLLGRLGAIQGFFHSHDCPRFELEWDSESSEEGRMTVRQDLSRQSLDELKLKLKTLHRKLWKRTLSLGFFPLSWMSSVLDAGRGFHYGCTFPMKDNPKNMETNPQGKLESFENVYLIDASSLPSIPATTITLPVMANAHRIASNAFRK